MRLAKEAEMKPPACNMTPEIMGSRFPNFRVHIVTNGATNMAIEKLKPPMKA